MRRLRVLTWHIHGNYLWYLSQANHDFILPVGLPGEGYGGRGKTFPFADNVREVHYEAVPDEPLDCILFQTRTNYEVDQYRLLSAEQQRLPRIYLEHDPPQEHPTNTRHWFDEPGGLLVHVTEFNRLMWDSGRTPARVIEHGVLVPEQVRYTGTIPRGIVVINHLRSRGRRLGVDVFERVREEVPLDLVGMAAEELDGVGEVHPPDLPAFESQYRFFFNPIRWTSLGLAVCEAMTIGMPIVGLATTEMVTAIQNGVSGYVETSVDKLIAHMQRLLSDPDEARELGAGARQYALERFDIRRFARDWNRTLEEVAGTGSPRDRGLAATAAGDETTLAPSAGGLSS